MGSFVVLIFFAGFFDVLQGHPYTTKWDDINIDEILSSERLLKNYKNCLMDQGSCTTQGTELKKTLPDALKTECRSCTPKQKEKSKKIIEYLIVNKPDWWKELEKKYDPTGIYYERRVLLMNKMKEEKNEKKIKPS